MGAVAHFIRRNFEATPWRLRSVRDDLTLTLAVGIGFKTLDIVNPSANTGFDLAFTSLSSGIDCVTLNGSYPGISEHDRSMDGVFYVNSNNPEAPRAGRINRDSFCCGARVLRCSNWELYVLGSGSAILSNLAMVAPPVAAIIMIRSATMVCLKLKDETAIPGAMYLGKIWDA
jgi:hypothetical protein